MFVEIGARLRAYRQAQRVSATAAAEAAGLSRATWVRIERGEPTVAAGAYAQACDVLGLALTILDPRAPSASSFALPTTISLSTYPQLSRLAWQLAPDTKLTPREALSLYERNWRHVNEKALSDDERRFIEALRAAFANELSSLNA